MGHIAYISLGSNHGSRKENLYHAIKLMDNTGIIAGARSSIYETEPQGMKDQPWFLNMVVRVQTGLSARELLQVLLKLELQMGRKRLVRWGPRIIDLDILLYDGEVIHQPDLEVPHPRMVERAFVLVPLVEIAPDLILPDGTPVRKYLLRLDGTHQGIKIYEE